MTIKVPNFKDPDVSKFLVEFIREQDRTDKEFMSSITANRSLLLYSPSKFVFEIKVSDAGILTATKVSG